MSFDGVLLAAHGTVESIAELPAFLARIRHGRPAPPELVSELERRYRAIGGSPLLDVTRAQASGLSAQLGLPVFVGMRLWRPELSEALAEAIASGVTRLCVVPLAPFSVHVYFAATERALAELEQKSEQKLELVAAAPFGQSAEFVAAQAALIRPRLADVEAEELVLTAHSLPAKIIASGDPYQSQVEASARAIALELGRPFTLAYQSQGADGGDWLGPDLKSVLELSKRRGKKRVVVAPVGFVSDHVETLYDLDIEARAWSTAMDLEFVRVPALNASEPLVSALAASARRALFG